MHRTPFLRTPRGMVLTDDGQEFPVCARQVVQQMDLLEEQYANGTTVRRFSVSTHHDPFAANAFVELVIAPLTWSLAGLRLQTCCLACCRPVNLVPGLFLICCAVSMLL